MSTSGSLTKHPTLLTGVLSLAALAGYVAYRFTLGASEPAPEATAAALPASDHMHESAPLADSLPELVLDDLAGTPTPLASIAAGQPLLINFWATWCAPCLREIPMLKTLHAEDPSIRVVGIAVDRLADVLEYAETTMEFTYPVLGFQTAAYDAMAAFHNDAQAMPFSVLIAADGATLGAFAGELHEEDLENLSATIADLNAGKIDRQEARERVAGLR